MSAAPQFPPNYGPDDRSAQQPPAPPKRPLWQRVLFWFGIGLLILCVVIVIGVYALLHSSSFHGYVLRTAQQKASAALNTNVHIQEFALNFHGISPTLDVYGVVVDGAAPYRTPPLLQIQHARVGVTVTSILGRTWYLNDLTVDRPIAQVFVDSNGHSNLPTFSSSGNSSSSTNVFDLGIRHALLDNGVVLYNNRKSVMEADLHNLELKAHYETSPQRYVGSLGYSNGHLKMATYNTINHDFHADFVATPKQFELKNAVLQSGPSKFVLNATMTNYSDPHITADYSAILNGGEFKHILKNPTVPDGDIKLSGKLTYAAQSNQSFLTGVNLTGELNSNKLVVNTPKFKGPIENLHANYTLDNDNLQVRNIGAQMLGGTLSGTLTTQNISTTQNSDLKATLQGVKVGRLKSLVKAPALNSVGVAGTADANLKATWSKGFNDVEADVNIDLNSTVTPHPADYTGGAKPQEASYTLPGNMPGGQAPDNAPAKTAAPGATKAASGKAASGNVATQTGRNSLTTSSQTAPEPTPQANASGAQTSNASASGNQGANSQSNNSVPVSGHIHLHYSGKNDQITLSNSYIKTPQTTLTFNGALNSRTGLAIDLNHVDLHKLTMLANVFSSSANPTLPPGLSGTASFHGHVRGSIKSPKLVGSLVVHDLDYNGSQWRLLRTDVSVSPSDATLSNGLLVSAVSGQASFNLNAGLHHWSFERSSEFKVGLDAQQLQLASLAKAANTQVPVTGVLNASINAHGTRNAPVGTAQLGITRAQLEGQPVQSIQAKLNSDGTVVQANLGVKLPAGNATASGTYNLQQENYQAVVKAVGIQLGKLEAVKSKDLGLTGTLDLNASGSGNIHNPQLNASLRIPKLQVHGQDINNIVLQTNIANHVANVALNSNAVNSAIRAKATVNLTGEYETSATIDTQSIPFAPLVAAYMPSQAGDITGQTELHGTITGPLKNKKLLQAHFTIPTLRLDYKNTVQIGAPQPIHFDYANGVLDLQRSALKGTDTDLQFQGRIPVINRAAPVSLLLQGSVNLKLLQALDPTVTSSGQLQFDINSFGQLANPNIEGQVRIINAGFTNENLPVGLSNGNGVLTLTRDRLQITSFDADMGGGKLSASGAVLYRPALRFDLAAQAREVHLLYPDGVRSSIGAKINLTGSTTSSLLNGQVSIYQLSFTPDFDLAGVMGQFGGPTVPTPTGSFTNNLKLQLAVKTPNGINLVNRQLSLAGSMNLRVVGTAADPAVLGRVALTGGDLLFNNERFVLQGGTIDFVNPTRTEPNLNVSVKTTVQQYDIGLRLEGPVEHMRTSYSSVPALPPADIIHLIAFGTTTEAAAASPSLPGNLAAEQKIASAVSSQVTSRVAKIAGLSQLSINPTLGAPGGEANPGATVTVQQRVTSKIFVTFSTDVTSARNEVIQLEYRKSHRLSFSGTRDQNGGFAFDTRIRKEW